MIIQLDANSETVAIRATDRFEPAPLVSVLMLTYNHEAYLGQALDSILAQRTNFSYEIVLGDDCSTDKTVTIAETFRARHPEKLRILRGERNIGVGQNFARTYSACRGRYIFILEGDDFWCDPGKMMAQVNILQENPDVALTYHSATAHIDGMPAEIHIGARRDLSSEELQSGAFINTLTVAFRAVLKDLPCEFTLAPVPDVFLWSLLGQHGRGFYLSDINPAYYRVHERGYFSSQSAEERARKMTRTYAFMMLYYGRIGMPILEANFRRKVVFFLLRSLGWRYWIREALKIALMRVSKKLGGRR